MMYLLIIATAVFVSTGLAFWVVNAVFYRSNQMGEEKPGLEDFGTNTFVVTHKGEDTGFF